MFGIRSWMFRVLGFLVCDSLCFVVGINCLGLDWGWKLLLVDVRGFDGEDLVLD